MSRHHNHNQIKVGGVIAGSLSHRILLALRGGECTQEQLRERYDTASYNAVSILTRAGLAEKPPRGSKGEIVRITQAGRALVAPGGPLSRSATEIVYCQL